ncbi:GNAT family N-acetyltransferase [Actinophytocola oryzae]|uniref:RimJ/RimL family protein N-acetyltransferase n=1 Tax=Actinophytocola oryzae TaxID=502181 RepID=A0A4R7W3A0_9PSEU|nr:GNAT family N-acetyltransferase [Actinophytocola oryzae]TDV56077.1 RimJ/RimL family protein N-acetyltransferase [Actinophytocola oryzae]
MTITNDPLAPVHPGRREPDDRDTARADLARLLHLLPEDLSDDTLLVAELGLDSVAMMTVAGWLESRGVVLGPDRSMLGSVGEVLSLAGRAAPDRRLSFVVTDEFGPTAVPQLARTLPSEYPVMENNSVRLTPIVDNNDVGFLYAMAVEPETCFRWRYRGAPPSLERFTQDLWAQVLVQLMVRRVDDDLPIGHVVAYSADTAQGHAYVGAVFQARHTGLGLASEATSLFIRYLFHNFPLRKVYMETPGFNYPQIRSAAGTLFEVEGVLRDHDYFAGRYWDKYLLAIYPEHAAGPLAPRRSGSDPD